ncbi:MAG: hypothetical protein PHH58_08420 [Rhodoferax sp.]|nr:hypothetical protein [Rhodoferax sp.]
MKPSWMLGALFGPLLGLLAVSVSAQEPIYRCGNEYTNTRPDAKAKGCKLVEGGNITVIPATHLPKNGAAKASTGSNTKGAAQVSAVEQKARDSDARLILQGELNKAEARLQAIKDEYNNGEPERRGAETRNYQKYLDRVAELKASIARTESDIAGIRRELGRLSAAGAASAQ